MYIVRVVTANSARRYAYLKEREALRRKAYWERRPDVVKVTMLAVGLLNVSNSAAWSRERSKCIYEIQKDSVRQ